MQLTDAQTIAALLGIVMTLVGIVLTSNHRLANAFKEQTVENKKRFDRIDARLDKVDERFDDVNRRFDDVNKRFDDVNKRFDAVYTCIDALRGDINHDVNGRFDAMNLDMNHRFDALNRATPPDGTNESTSSQHRHIVG